PRHAQAHLRMAVDAAAQLDGVVQDALGVGEDCGCVHGADYKRLDGVCFGVVVVGSRQQATLSIERTEEGVRVLLALIVAVLVLMPLSAAAAPEGRSEAPVGQITIAAHVSLAPTWFDPAETPGVITPFLTLYA